MQLKIEKFKKNALPPCTFLKSLYLCKRIEKNSIMTVAVQNNNWWWRLNHSVLG